MVVFGEVQVVIFKGFGLDFYYSHNVVNSEDEELVETVNMFLQLEQRLMQNRCLQIHLSLQNSISHILI